MRQHGDFRVRSRPKTNAQRQKSSRERTSIAPWAAETESAPHHGLATGTRGRLRSTDEYTAEYTDEYTADEHP
jgi:hypothetical protein